MSNLISKNAAVLGALAVVGLLVPYVTGQYWVGIATEAIIFAIVALGLNVLIGHAGLVSVGHAGLFAVSAYTAALTQTRYDLGFLTSAIVAIAVTIAVTAIFAIAAVRTTAMYFLMITLATGMLIWGLAHRYSALTGGENGALSGIRPGGFTQYYQYYWLVLAVFVVVAAALWLFLRSGAGIRIRGTRDSAVRMTSIGYSPSGQRFVAFLVSGAVTAIAGVLYAGYYPVVSPSTAHLSTSILFMLMVIVGGSGMFLGPALGAILLTVLRAAVSAETPRWPTVMGIVLIVVVLFARNGITGTVAQWLKSRRAKKLAATVAVAGALTACAPALATDADAERTTGPITVGYVDSLSGALAGAGLDMLQGTQLWLAEHDNKMAGREVDLLVEDDQGSTETGVQVTKRLVEQRQADLVIGPLAGNVGVALGRYVTTTDVPLVYPIPTSDVFVHDSYPNVFPVTGTAPQFNVPLGEWAAKEGHDRVVTICSDYTFGQEVCGGFASGLTASGGSLAGQLWPPLGSSDFAPFISQLRQSDADAVFVGLIGADSVKFLKAWRDFGMDGRMTLLGSDPSFDQAVLRGVGKAAMGLVSIGHYAEGRDSPASSTFAAAFQKKYGKLPSYYAASGYLAADWTARALEANGGKVGDATDFVRTLRTISYDDSVFGPISVDDRGQPIYTVYLRKVKPGPGGLPWNTVTEEFPDVGATGGLSYEEYLDRPVFSREYQGATK
ncbi:ABC transporter substrate-binding protein [Kribbella sp. NPDC049174]|uniref:ABC transporter substrate-binding protein n=1 Tax=Kribbella sp. NPDC049174 TaxID=3364112 RepID=UPI00371E1B98